MLIEQCSEDSLLRATLLSGNSDIVFIADLLNSKVPHQHLMSFALAIGRELATNQSLEQSLLLSIGPAMSGGTRLARHGVDECDILEGANLPRLLAVPANKSTGLRRTRNTRHFQHIGLNKRPH